jgi:hypothetical protein
VTDELRSRITELEQQLAALKADLDLDRGDAATTSRRGMLRAVAAAGVAGVVGATVATRPAAAATGDNFVLGQSNTANAVTALRNDGPFPDINGPGPIALKLESPGAHIQFVGALGDAVRGTYPNGTLAYNGGTGLLLWSNDNVVRVADGSTSPVHLLAAPERIYDSRQPESLGASGTGPLASGEDRQVSLGFSLGVGNDLLNNASAGAMINLTIVSTAGSGYLTVGPPAMTAPSTSNVNWTAPGQVVANMAITALNEGGLQLWVGGGGATHVIIDVMAILG